ncbi:MAG TPA: tRNA (adenosine(37)-N6)-threonylcarbamoyltransferase complex dimerization subunit type 1 TsaB [Pyrinomonadaceae bacterium]|nr:tRNA (adenosine(37)-N6)-threonylcarbamoyltransferase complex dimerization subunit type 1 TsaB [Pyrinomonadaceae bacterium]
MTDSTLILSVETATLGGSVCVTRRGEELSVRAGSPAISHSNTLLRDIDETLKSANVRLQDVDLFACAAGPGSFTGLRIGIATVKALAATLERPLIGIPTLHAVAHAAGPSQATVALLPAGRGEVFAQLFSVSEQLDVNERDRPGHLSPQKLMERYGDLRDVVWTGPGVTAQADFLKSSGVEFQIAEQPPILARHVAALALRLYEAGNVQTPESLSAIYVRPSDAELKLECR